MLVVYLFFTSVTVEQNFGALLQYSHEHLVLHFNDKIIPRRGTCVRKGVPRDLNDQQFYLSQHTVAYAIE